MLERGITKEMVQKVIKRNGKVVKFNKSKVIDAISKSGFIPLSTKEDIANKVENLDIPEISVEQIQDIVEQELMKIDPNVARSYVRYRYKRELIRNDTLRNDTLGIISSKNDEISEENSNKNSLVLSTQRDYMAGEISKDITDKLLLPDDVLKAHREGIIHVHDRDYFVQHMMNCCLVNLDDMLQNGTVISGTMIEKPHSFSTACNIATQIMAQVASNQYGGQTESIAHLAPFVDVSRNNLRKEVREEYKERLEEGEIDKLPNDSVINRIAEKRLHKEVRDGVQTIQYQILTLMTTNGQTPFVSLFLGLDEAPEGQTREDLALIIEEILKQRLRGIKNEKGAWITPAFPKLIYLLEEDNISEDSKYWYLTKLAAKCTAKRMVPDYISAKKMKELKGDIYPCMGCRSFLSPDRFSPEGETHKYYGRFNQGVVTINLVDVSLSAKKEEGENSKRLYDTFWKILDKRLELCHKALKIRHQRLVGTLSDVSPIHWQYGALARLDKHEKIDKYLYGGYSTISLGYAGLYECVYAMTGKSHTDPEAKPFAISIMKHLNDKCNEWKAKEDIDYSVYGTPIESTTYKFAKSLKARFGEIENVTDHNYITNSYHVNVREKIDPFTKLKFESEFQELSPGGAISYIETANLDNNIDAVLEVIKYIYENIIYAELNTKSDYCKCCGYTGEIQIYTREDGKLGWKCPNCGNTDQSQMNVARRTCGYIGTNFWTMGRTEEIRDRYVHLGEGIDIQ